MPDPDRVAKLLADSKAAHLQYQSSKRLGNLSQARNFLNLAAEKRRSAVAEDPDRTAPAWVELEPQFPHVMLTDFYAKIIGRA